MPFVTFLSTVPPEFNVETGIYNLELVFLSFLVAAVSAYTSLLLADRMVNYRAGFLRHAYHIASALALGGGIWSMHFLGMLAYDMKMYIEYDIGLTLLSFIIAVVCTYLSLLSAFRKKLSVHGFVIAAALLGFAIIDMHYIGMAAMDMDATIYYDPWIFALSCFIAFAASAATLAIIFSLRNHKGKFKSFWRCAAAITMALAVCGMHYTGIAASIIVPFANCRYAPDQSFHSLELAVEIMTAIMLLACFILILREKERKKERSGMGAFPLKLLTMSKIMTLVVLFIVAGNLFYLLTIINSDHEMARDHIDFVHPIEESIQFSSYLMIILSAVIIITWVFLFRSMRRWYWELIDAKDSLAAQKNFLDTLLEHLPLPMIVKDPNDNFKMILINDAGVALGQETREVIIGTTYERWMPPEEAAIARATDEKVMREGKIVEIPEVEITNAKRNFTARTYNIPIYDEKGNPFILLSMFEDITDRVKNQRALEEAKEAAEAASKAKSEFLANMSHEFRTPMNSILGMTKLILEDETVSPEHHSMLEVVHRSGMSLLALVNDILDISKIEANKITIEHIPFDLERLLTDLCDTLKPIASAKGLTMYQDNDLRQFRYLKGDPLKINQILTNLVGNAIKYTLVGSVRIETLSEDIEGNKSRLKFSVTDTGIGIPKSKIGCIFDQFGQADSSITRRFGGTGLGLTITRHLVEMMGGQIEVESIENVGSRFTVVIDLEKASAAELIDAEVSQEKIRQDKKTGLIPVSKARILVAEDHLMNQIFIGKLLPSIGILNFTIVEDGLKAKQAMADSSYDLVLMDCHMPHKSGYDVTREWREQEEEGKRLPIVAMTANAMEGEREKCIACGMDEYVSKPVTKESLMRALGYWIDFSEVGYGEYSDTENNEIINLSLIQDISDGDVGLEKMLLSAFVSETQQSLLNLSQVFGPEKEIEWRDIAHKIKGGASNIGANKLYTLCADAQKNYQADAAYKALLYSEIKSAFDDICLLLNEKNLLE